MNDEAGENGCCPGPRGRVEASPQWPGTEAARASEGLRRMIASDMVTLKGGFFEMGARRTRYAPDQDGPPRRVALSPFAISRVAVSNAVFARFVTESGYRTTAEREGWSFVFQGHLADPSAHPETPPGTPWWRKVAGACWHAPEGPGSGIEARWEHPVTHVSWDDATAFCVFTGTRLPTEAEWEYAARGGLRRMKYPWGNALQPGGTHCHNVWQGPFPEVDTAEDGFAGPAPVTAFEPNGYGLWNMTGNVWEWCADWFGALPEARRPPPRDPSGPESGPGRVMRGGSFMCHASYCERYFVHSRTMNTPDSSTGHIGFRVANVHPPDRNAAPAAT